MVTTVGAGVLGAALLVDLYDESGELPESFSGVDTGAGSAVESKDPSLKEVVFHSVSAARNSPVDSMRRKRTWVGHSLKLNSKPSFNARDDTTVTPVVGHTLAISAAVKVALLMKQ